MKTQNVRDIFEKTVQRVQDVLLDPREVLHAKAPKTPDVRQPADMKAPPAIGSTERHNKIAESAYLRAEHRGFLPGCELQDWLEAEAEVDKLSRQVS